MLGRKITFYLWGKSIIKQLTDFEFLKFIILSQNEKTKPLQKKKQSE